MQKAPFNYKAIVYYVILTAICQLTSRMAVIFLPFATNDNIAFNLAVSNFYAIIISAVMLLLGLFTVFKQKEDSIVIFVVMAGISSNIIDRIVFRGVIDYINLFGLTLGNLADILIVGGLVVFGYNNIFATKKARG